MYKGIMLKILFQIILFIFLFIHSSNSQNFKKILINGNERISKSTIILFGNIDNNLNYNDNNMERGNEKSSGGSDIAGLRNVVSLGVDVSASGATEIARNFLAGHALFTADLVRVVLGTELFDMQSQIGNGLL